MSPQAEVGLMGGEFISFFEDLRAHVRFVDFIDVGVVAVLIYVSLMWLRTRASRRLVVALILVGGLYLTSRVVDLYLTNWLLQAGFTAILIGLILVFQDDLRSAVERLAAWARRRPTGQAVSSIDVLVETVGRLADERVGALIVLRGRDLLDQHVRNGVPLDGAISGPLLFSIFDTHSPGHDGAAVVEGERIVEFCAVLPLTRNLPEIGERGTRHAAAVGLSECCDSLIIVVSEERGTISVAQDGRLDELESAVLLNQRIEQFLEHRFPARNDGPRWSWLTWNLALKLFSLSLAVFLWGLVASRVDTIERPYDVAIEYRNLPRGWMLRETRPTSARVTLQGSERDFDRLDPDRLSVSIELGNVREGPIYISEGEIKQALRNANGLSVDKVEPSSIRLDAFRVREAVLAVKPRFVGRVPQGKTLDFSVKPASVRVLINAAVDARTVSAITTPIDLERVSPEPIRSDLVLPDDARFLPESDTSVEVTVRFLPTTSEQPAAAADHRSARSLTSSAGTR